MLHGVETFLDDMGIFCKDDIACPLESCFYCTDLRLASSDTSKICHKVSTVCPLKQTVQYWRKQFSHQSLPLHADIILLLYAPYRLPIQIFTISPIWIHQNSAESKATID